MNGLPKILNPLNDGIDHINVYSKGKTTLGRQLSNFSYSTIRIPLMGRFLSVEAFWYWWMTGDDRVRGLWGWRAKSFGKNLATKRPHPNKRVLKIAYRAKLKSQPYLRELLSKNKLPLAHYYVYNGKVVVPKQWVWTATLWNEL